MTQERADPFLQAVALAGVLVACCLLIGALGALGFAIAICLWGYSGYRAYKQELG